LLSAFPALAKEVVLRVHQLVGHLHGGVDDLLPPGRPLAERRGVKSHDADHAIGVSELRRITVH
jgi:hypothetical protein